MLARLGDPGETGETGEAEAPTTTVYVGMTVSMHCTCSEAILMAACVLGDLPFVRVDSAFATADAVLAALTSQLRATAKDSFEVDLNAKRGFAMVNFESAADAQQVLRWARQRLDACSPADCFVSSATDASPIVLGGRTLVLAPANSGAIQRLVELAETLKLAAPVYSLQTTSRRCQQLLLCVI